VCATGKTADEMLAILQERLRHAPEDERHIASGEQAKITAIRLNKLLRGD
jgi:2-oxo-4-hydroxy-4-carboxy--5-ureidoimidazoline (OHCU) decarboxylase